MFLPHSIAAVVNADSPWFLPSSLCNLQHRIKKELKTSEGKKQDQTQLFGNKPGTNASLGSTLESLNSSSHQSPSVALTKASDQGQWSYHWILELSNL